MNTRERTHGSYTNTIYLRKKTKWYFWLNRDCSRRADSMPANKNAQRSVAKPSAFGNRRCFCLTTAKKFQAFPVFFHQHGIVKPRNLGIFFPSFFSLPPSVSPAFPLSPPLPSPSPFLILSSGRPWILTIPPWATWPSSSLGQFRPSQKRPIQSVRKRKYPLHSGLRSARCSLFASSTSGKRASGVCPRPCPHSRRKQFARPGAREILLTPAVSLFSGPSNSETADLLLPGSWPAGAVFVFWRNFFGIRDDLRGGRCGGFFIIRRVLSEPFWANVSLVAAVLYTWFCGWPRPRWDFWVRIPCEWLIAQSVNAVFLVGGGPLDSLSPRCREPGRQANEVQCFRTETLERQ